jgi:two-component system response regulator AtoC
VTAGTARCGRFGGRPAAFDQPFGHSPQMKAIKAIIDQVADTDATVLVWGETGVGKELVARAIHGESARGARTMVKINCAALPPDLLESELFGYEQGAFTGAGRRTLGKFEVADGGSIFLDEIGEMPMPLQAKLLHVLQDRAFSRLGGQREIVIDTRVVASTNRDLGRAVAQGLFREDLYHRLNVINIHVPPLRERPEEIPILAEGFREKDTRQYDRGRPQLSPELLDRFSAYSWPGNVRELENLVKRIVVLQSEEQVLSEFRMRSPSACADVGLRGGVGLKEIARRAARKAEYEVLKQVLEEVHWNRGEAAKLLKVSYKTLLTKIRMHDWGSPASERGARR